MKQNLKKLTCLVVGLLAATGLMLHNYPTAHAATGFSDLWDAIGTGWWPRWENSTYYNNVALNWDPVTNVSTLTFSATNYGLPWTGYNITAWRHRCSFIVLERVVPGYTQDVVGISESATGYSVGFYVYDHNATHYRLGLRLRASHMVVYSGYMQIGTAYDVQTFGCINRTDATHLTYYGNVTVYAAGQNYAAAAEVTDVAGGYEGNWEDWAGNVKAYFTGTPDYFGCGIANQTLCKAAADLEVDTVNFDIVDAHGPDNWVFVDEKFYRFNVSIWSSTNATIIDTVLMNFTLPTDYGNVTALFSYNAANWTVTVTPENTERTLDPVRTETGTCSFSTDWHYAFFIFHVWFTPRALDCYQNDARDVNAWANDTAGHVTEWVVVVEEYFSVYSKGGFSLWTNETGPSCGPIAGGNLFSLYCGNNSEISRDIIFSNLQHIKILPEVDFKVGYQAFILHFGVDYYTDNAGWLRGWSVKLTASSCAFENVLGGERWINFTVKWYNRNDVTPVREDAVYMFHRGNAAAVGAVSYTTFWIDLWFDRENSSSVGGGRLNAYEFPMMDNANPWLRWLSTDWGIKQGVAKESMFRGALLDEDNATLSSTHIKLVQTYLRVQVGAAETDQQVYLTNYEVFDTTLGPLPLLGTQTPAFDETVTPVMPQGGFLGILTATFSWWSKWLSENVIWGGLSLWPSLVAFLDSIAAWLGYPSAFSNFLTWISDGWAWFVSSVTWLFSLLAGGFTFLAIWFGKFITLVSTAFTYMGAIVTGIISFIDGTAGGASNVFTGLNLMQWIILGIVLYPIYLVILWDEHGLDAVESELRRDWWLLSTVGHIFLMIAQFMISAIGTLIESIPVAE